MLERRRPRSRNRRASGPDSFRFACGYLAAAGYASSRSARTARKRRRERNREMEFNDIDPIGQEEEPRLPFRNHRLRRGVYILPSACTVANMLCGYYAILATLDGKITDFDNAACAVGVAYLFDAMDGRIARAMKTESAFGFHSAGDAANAPEALHLTQTGWLVGFFFVACCAWRLARFNIQGMAPGGNRYFVGLPTPAAAGVIAATVHFFHGRPIEDVRASFVWLGLLVVLGVLMSSTLRFFSFKDIPLTRRQPSLAVILLALLVGAVVYFSH